jgi:hypothetical protein
MASRGCNVVCPIDGIGWIMQIWRILDEIWVGWGILDEMMVGI